MKEFKKLSLYEDVDIFYDNKTPPLKRSCKMPLSENFKRDIKKSCIIEEKEMMRRCAQEEKEPSISLILSPQEFEHIMKITKRRYKDDPEECHMHMDSIMGTMLEDLGYGEGVKVFDSVMKWYS